MCLEVSLPPFFFVAAHFFTLSSGNIPRQGQDSDCTSLTSMCTKHALHMTCNNLWCRGNQGQFCFKGVVRVIHACTELAIHFSRRRLALKVCESSEMPGEEERKSILPHIFVYSPRQTPKCFTHRAAFLPSALFAYQSHPGIIYARLYIDSASGSGFKFRPSAVT